MTAEPKDKFDRLLGSQNETLEAHATFDRRFMEAAIRYARRHEGVTGENPSVAALIVRYENNQPLIVGRGVTSLGGRPHAEVNALAEAGELAREACAYVTLEPCAHFGKTPPCVEALINAGISRVVVASDDPDERVSGKGFETLRAAGIDVITGVSSRQSDYGLAGFLTRTTKHRPFVTLKLAMTADGFIGSRSGEQVKITNDISNRQVHLLRAINDAILVGSGTVLNDDPSLTCRLPDLAQRSPKRVILDRQLQISAKSKILQTADKVQTYLVTEADKTILPALENSGIKLISLQSDEDQAQLSELLSLMPEQEISTLFVEGGATVAKAFLDADLVDRLVIFQSDVSIGAVENAVKAPISPRSIGDEFEQLNKMTFGNDIMYEYQRKDH